MGESTSYLPEGEVTGQQNIGDDTKGPYITLVVVALSVNDLGGNIVRRPKHGLEDLMVS